MTDHPDWPRVLAQVLAEPESDTPRLVAADWLDEHDQGDRAEFIRESVRLADLTIRAESGSTHYTDGRPHSRHWVVTPGTGFRFAGCCPLVRAMLPDPATVDSFVAVVRRGFVDRVECPPPHWEQHADALLAEHPVREVIITGPLALDTSAFGGFVRDPASGTYRAARWPGVVFKLPEFGPLAAAFARLERTLAETVDGVRAEVEAAIPEVRRSIEGMNSHAADQIRAMIARLSPPV